MASDRTLKVNFTGAIECKYRRTDTPISPDAVASDVRYSDTKVAFTNGNGAGKVDLLYFKRHTLDNSVLVLDLDGGLQNLWNDTLNYDAVKLLMIVNRETTYGRYLTVQFKDERYNIGAGGKRIIIEPQGKGIEAFVSSGSSEEGALTFSSDTSVTFDLLIAGSSQESSSSSGS